MNDITSDDEPLSLEELKAEQSRIAARILKAQQRRIAKLKKELEELQLEIGPASSYEGPPKRRGDQLDPKSVVKRLYTIKEAAVSLSMSTTSVRRLVDRGLLKPNRTLGKLLFKAADLDRFVDETG